MTATPNDWAERAAASIAGMAAEWYSAPARGEQHLPEHLIARRLARFVPAAPAAPAPVAWQRRRQYSDVPGAVPAWETCTAREANNMFERRAGYEYRPLYTTPPTPVAASAVETTFRLALKRIADPNNIHFAGDAQVVAREALAATPSSDDSKAVRVRALDFNETNLSSIGYERFWQADTAFGPFRVGFRAGEYFTWFGTGSHDPEPHSSLTSAILFQRAQFDRRVRACLETGEASTVGYRNWRGEVSDRQIIPLRIWHGATDWHPEPQLLLTAWDVDKQAERDFALADFLPPPPAAEEG